MQVVEVDKLVSLQTVNIYPTNFQLLQVNWTFMFSSHCFRCQLNFIHITYSPKAHSNGPTPAPQIRRVSC